jgi:antitoxin PrlF
MLSSTITVKGQTTIPKAVREHLNLQSGDQLDFVIQSDGSVVVRPAALNVKHLRGILHRKNMKPVPVDAMNAAVQKKFRRLR